MRPAPVRSSSLKRNSTESQVDLFLKTNFLTLNDKELADVLILNEYLWMSPSVLSMQTFTYVWCPTATVWPQMGCTSPP